MYWEYVGKRGHCFYGPFSAAEAVAWMRVLEHPKDSLGVDDFQVVETLPEGNTATVIDVMADLRRFNLKL